MALKGDLASVDLSQVFQMLALNQKVGLLRIQAPGISKALYFDHRGVTLCYDEHLLLDKVLVTMTRTGELPSSAVQDAREHAAGRGISVIDSLLAGGFLSAESYEHGLSAELVEEIYDLFFWREARFEFFEGQTEVEGVDGTISPRFFFSTDSLIMEAARRIDEWSYIEKCVPSELEVFRLLKRANVVDLGDGELAVMDLVDGKRNVRRMIEITGMRPFQVFKALAILIEEEAIGALPNEKLVAAANECIGEGRQQDAVNLLERAITLRVGYPETHGLIAGVYENRQEFAAAGYHLKCLAEYHATKGEVDRACSLLKREIEMLPTDLHARERLIELEVGMSGGKGATTLAEGKLLVDLYLEIGELERVQNILEGMLRQNPQNFDLKKSLVNVHTRSGNTKRVIELYELIAADFVRERRPIEAVGYLQKILMIDRSRRDVTERIKSLYELDERRRNRRRNLVLLGALFFVISALCGVWYFYEDYARKHYEKLDVSELVAVGDYEACANLYRSFQKSYPLTIASRDAEDKLAWIESLRLANDAQIKHAELKREAELNQLRAQYRLAWDRYEAEFQAHNLEASLKWIEQARELSQKADQPIDRRWAKRVKLEKSRNDLRNYSASAVQLREHADKALRDGDWREARKHLVRLVTQFDMAAQARDVRLPVLLDSHPRGAHILVAGVALTRDVDGEVEPLTTPAVVFCHHGKPQAYELVREGFLPQKVSLDARKSSEVSLVLTVVPRAILSFPAPVLSSAGADGRSMAVSLQGGRVGIGSPDRGEVVRVVQLEELSEIVGKPVVARGRTTCLTNDSRVVSYTNDGVGQDWQVALADAPASEICIVGGRVLFSDEAGHLICLQFATGTELWRRDLGGATLGRAIVHNRKVHVVAAGQRFVLDAVDGKISQTLTLPSAPSTGPIAVGAGETFLIGTQDRRLHLFDARTADPLWSITVPDVLTDDRVAVAAQGAVLAIGSELWRISLDDGTKTAERALNGELASGPVASQRLVAVTVLQQIDRTRQQHLLLAFDPATLEAQWEFSDGSLFRGAVTTDGTALYLPDSERRVLCFR